MKKLIFCLVICLLISRAYSQNFTSREDALQYVIEKLPLLESKNYFNQTVNVSGYNLIFSWKEKNYSLFGGEYIENKTVTINIKDIDTKYGFKPVINEDKSFGYLYVCSKGENEVFINISNDTQKLEGCLYILPSNNVGIVKSLEVALEFIVAE